MTIKEANGIIAVRMHDGTVLRNVLKLSPKIVVSIVQFCMG